MGAALTLSDRSIRCRFGYTNDSNRPKVDGSRHCLSPNHDDSGSAPSDLAVVRELELGYTFAKQYWGHGYATESAIAVRDHIFQNGHHDRLLAGILPGNIASKKVAGRLGMNPIGPINAFGLPAEGYEIKKADWERC